MSNQDRQPREAATREATKREETWAPPELLPKPIEQAGYSYRYIRIATMGLDDPTNVSRSFRVGWEPVTLAEQQEIARCVDKTARGSGNIEIGGLMLCKAPTEMINRRRAYYDNLTRQAAASVNNNLMKENDSRMPLFSDSKSKTSFGSGS